MSNTDLIETITINFGDSTEVVTKENYKEILNGLDAMIGGCYNGNDIIDEAMTDLVEKFYEVERGSEAWKHLNENYDKLREEQMENLASIRKCEGTMELIKKFAEIREWE